MDLLTQGLLGACLAQSRAPRHEQRLASAIGFFAGIIADADILIRSSSDPLLNLEYHRHFSHSLLFIPFGALLASLLLWPFLRTRLSFKPLYIYCLLGFSLSGFLDACTSYGTHLLWPFTDERISFSIIAIIDPLFSLVLLLALLLSWKTQLARYAQAGLLIAGCYLLIGALQHHRAEQFAMQLAEQRGHQPERLLVKPTLANLLLWRSVYQYQDQFYIDAVRVGLLADNHVYYGGKLTKYSVTPGLDELLRNDIERFSHFSDGFIAQHPEHSHIIGDVRYAIEPTSTIPLWGIELHPGQSPAVSFRFFRQVNEEQKSRFIIMLLGKSLH